MEEPVGGFEVVFAVVGVIEDVFVVREDGDGVVPV